MRENGSSPGRGNYREAMQSEQLVYDTRKALCKLLGIKRPSHVVFTANATESINLVLKGYLEPGDRVLTTSYEHNAVWRPLKSLEKYHGIHIETMPCSPQGDYNFDLVRKQIGRDIKLVAASHGSNVLGNITPLEKIIAIAHEANVPVLVDAAQTAGVYPINAENMGIDFLAFTGHKGLMGPTGTGGLYIREGYELKTFKEGGTGSMAASPYQPDDAPDRFEAGTLNIFGIAGLHAAAQFLLEAGVENVRSHEVLLMKGLLTSLQEIKNMTIYGPMSASARLGLVSFNLQDQSPYEVARKLDESFGIKVRAGLHCAPQAHRMIGTVERGAVRVSLGYFTTAQELDALVSALQIISS
jgi:cysteine desulfurase family protein